MRIVLLLFAVSCQLSFAQAITEQDQPAAPFEVRGTLVHGGEENGAWQLIGCMPSEHACQHYAQDQGYDFSYAQHDHETCHHGPSYACYAR